MKNNKEINIADILRKKAVGTKIYSLIHGEITIERIAHEDNSIYAKDINGLDVFFRENGHYYNDFNNNGECILFPSNEMRDWSKFDWKKGDVIYNGPIQCIFSKWQNDYYTKFECKFGTHENICGNVIDVNYLWEKETNQKIIDKFIQSIEHKYGGTLNLDTLEIEEQPEFKDGYIVSKEHEFKPFEKVLVRDEYSDVWVPDFFYKYSDDNSYKYLMITREFYRQCIPYDGNEHLFDTSDDWKGGEK